MADYDALLDDEIKAYIARCEASYPPEVLGLDIAGHRRVYNEMCADFDVGRPAGVSVQDEAHGGWPCRRYEAGTPTATVVYFHGGGFVVGGLDSHDSICAEICAVTGLRVISVDYPLAPEHRFPADFEAAQTAFQAIAARWPGPVVLSGDSAGGNLAAGVAHAARAGGPRPVGQVLIYPGLGGEWDWPSYQTHAEAPQLTLKDMMYYKDIRAGGAAPWDDPRYAPVRDADMAGVPPTICITAECDPLTSDSEIYCARLREAGGRALWIDEPGLVHGYLRARFMSAKAAASFSRICRAISALAAEEWPGEALAS